MSVLGRRMRKATIDAARIKLFISAEQTGTGASQNVAHTLGVVPTAVFIALTGDARAAWAACSIVPGTHTSTNIVVTVTASMLFRVIAIA